MGANETITARFGDVTVSIPARDIVRRIALEALSSATAKPASIAVAAATPEVGDYWEEHSGIYAGRLVGEDDQVYALIVAGRAAGEFSGVTWETAKTKAAALDINGFVDWSLPDRAEALAMYQRLHSKLKDSSDAFAGEAYWTSTQHAAVSGSAWCQGFNYGTQYYDRKDYDHRARAVRRAVIQ